MTATTKNLPASLDASETLIPASLVAPSRDLVPEDEAHWYHVGALPSLPFLSVDIAGVSFCKQTEEVGRGKDHNGQTPRTLCAGSVIKLTRDQVRRIAAKVAHKAVRLQPAYVDPHAGLDVSKDIRSRFDATIVRIPTAEELAEAEKQGCAHRFPAYKRRDTDTPLADHVYLVWLNEEAPRERSVTAALPLPMSKTGIKLPPLGARPAPSSELPTRGGADSPFLGVA